MRTFLQMLHNPIIIYSYEYFKVLVFYIAIIQ